MSSGGASTARAEGRSLRVLGLASYPEHAAATRFRLLQYVPLLAGHGIELDVRPFLSNRVFAGLYDRRRVGATVTGVLAGVLRRTGDALRLNAYDALFVQREAALVGPPVLEWLARRRRLPLVLDLDDATYIHRPGDTYGRLATALKAPGKPARLIRWSSHVVCGNPAIADHAARAGRPTTILPTQVDLDRFAPRRERPAGDLVVGWIGSHSTLPYLATLAPVFRRLARDVRFRLRVVGGGRLEIAGVDVECLPWRLEREVADLQSFDVGVYPLSRDEWSAAKSGFKAIQYLSCGIPFVASPVGVVGQIGVAGVTHLAARDETEWLRSLALLLGDAGRRDEMGRQGRSWAEAHYSTAAAAATLAAIFRGVATPRRLA